MNEKPIRYSIPVTFAEKGLENLYPNSLITDLNQIPTGFANSIFTFKKDEVALVLRMPPTVTQSLIREIELMKSLYHEGIPVPHVLEYDPTYENPLGHPFMIMERLEGTNLLEAAGNLNKTQTGNLLRDTARTLYRIHRVNTTNLKVMKFTTLKSFIDSGISNIRRFAAFSHMRNFEKFENWMQKNRPSETTYNKALIHNDFHPLNIMVSGESLSGILDWVDAIVGEVQVDVALFSLLAEAAGYPELARTFVSAYQQVSGLPLREIDFYVTALAIQKLIQIPLQKKQMEDTGQREKAELLSSLQSRLEKNLMRIIKENTGLYLHDFQ